MLLKNVIKDIQRHNWFAVFLDFAVVVIGILVAMQLADWEENKNESKITEEYTLLLMEDLKADQRSAKNAENYYFQVQQFGKNALTLWANSQGLSPEQLVVSFYQASNIFANNSTSGTYDSLASTGRLGLIGGPQLASTLSNYYARALDSLIYSSPPYRMEVRGILPPDVQDLIRQNCVKLTIEGTLNEVLSDTCDIGLNTKEAQSILSDLKEHPKIAFYLRQKIALDALATEVLKLQSIESKRLLEIINKVHAEI
ncbi:hypothetical protein [Paraglaciecola sp. MB-3u-78]|jgi:hypothetical protein|uniref:hypothetical protein n=1 Tax=Paraglaciecola sp. MB-3u-78 TaxID=2058332 RepID=UPI000C344037|nr:hypothetical protein [Paraglaciecola sp. MB-3u-78]PKG96828.1 hypothetical protein CXF95_23810 [Paraglaciecola sp. MB-3u-78]